MSPRDITVPITKPETEWVRGRPLQKVSPTRSHAVLQALIAAALRTWAGTRGEVGTEWRFRVAPPGEVIRPLVPDVCYVAMERLRGPSGRDLEVPPAVARRCCRDPVARRPASRCRR
ncbi:MAG: Uma2 family endonuclease [Candidatus Eremiobacteraeota bacterium]|nr:Uma2 family endonuclease [Candidatus Eremiobacteraeota bacterium]